jgi:hypothetical protein
MKNFFMVLLLLCASFGFAQEEELELYEPHHPTLGSLTVGWTRYFNVIDSYAKPSGYSVGLLVPLNIPSLNSHIKIKGTYFDVEGNQMASLVNELLFGKIAYEEDYLFVLPQFGIGARTETILSRFEDRYLNVKLFLDASIRFDYHLETVSTGLMFNFEYDMPSDDPGLVSDSRFCISFIITK